ncbi:MAG: hypothetical protein HDS13_10255 [Bacteroides sp.]|nr:hypothetical protein [Bacteroides sp.]
MRGLKPRRLYQYDTGIACVFMSSVVIIKMEWGENAKKVLTSRSDSRVGTNGRHCRAGSVRIDYCRLSQAITY